MKTNQKVLDEIINTTADSETKLIWTAVKRASNCKLDLPLVQKLGLIYGLLESTFDDISKDQRFAQEFPTVVAKIFGATRILANCEAEAARSIEIPVEFLDEAKERIQEQEDSIDSSTDES